MMEMSVIVIVMTEFTMARQAHLVLTPTLSSRSHFSYFYFTYEEQRYNLDAQVHKASKWQCQLTLPGKLAAVFSSTVSASCSHCNKRLQIPWIKTEEFYSLTF